MKKFEFDGFNTGGIENIIYAVPRTSFVCLQENATAGRCRLVLTRREDIAEIYTVPDTAVFSAEAVREAAGRSLNVSITGVIPKAGLQNMQLIRELECAPHLVLFRDNNGNIRLAGTEENPLMFAWKETSGTISSRNQIEFEFSGWQMYPCHIIHSMTEELF